MAGRKKNKKVHEPFESYYDNGQFTKFACDMYKSNAWQELSISQIGLYHIFKSKFTRHKDGTYNTNDISLPKSEWINYYKTKAAFDRDIDTLIELGFIKVILYQGNLRKCTIYGFNDQWKYYKTDKFNITDKDKRPKNTLSEEHKKAISDKAKETNEKRYSSKTQ